MKSGSIILFTKRKLSLNPRSWLSWLISLSGKYVHTSIIFEINKRIYVRDVDYKGNETVLLSDYIREFKSRITIKENPFHSYPDIEFRFNYLCKTEKIKYDFWNLLVFQWIKLIFNKFIGRETKLKRTCSEDTSRMFNILKPNYFQYFESKTPSEIAEQIKNWKTINLNDIIL